MSLRIFAKADIEKLTGKPIIGGQPRTEFEWKGRAYSVREIDGDRLRCEDLGPAAQRQTKSRGR